MGALEALNGLLLFGWTTALLNGHLQRVWPRDWVPTHAPAASVAVEFQRSARAVIRAERGPGHGLA